jgi:hypothetical protein
LGTSLPEELSVETGAGKLPPGQPENENGGSAALPGTSPYFDRRC